jgi:hypothetical protein
VPPPPGKGRDILADPYIVADEQKEGDVHEIETSIDCIWVRHLIRGWVRRHRSFDIVSSNLRIVGEGNLAFQ